MTERRFTPEEANAALAEVRPLVERMVEAKQAMDRAQERRDELGLRISGNGGGIPPAELAEANTAVEERTSQLGAIVDEIHALGVQVKDLDTGLVDFPSMRDGEDVLLCWRLGEDEIAYWHGLEDGFAGRQPL
ncbi:MAG TPA: DUF2203 domain-containing protein [Gaiellaceae bacterium]|nr:DUF2203 domain-containing protein [Gaiellaceae bacterium]